MPNKLILVVNHENITRCRYAGDERYMLVCNSLFRIGGAAVLMSNRCKPLQACLVRQVAAKHL